MIPYKHPQEKEMILRYVKLLDDSLAETIILRDSIESKEEAVHLAQFFWQMVDRSNIEDKESGENSEYILEKIIITFMAYFNSSGYENEWDEVTDKR
ncbi:MULTISPECIES: hypothetical protein [Thalassolituus]|jgi:hypothetical protein|uniref:Uncharacterized protein n=1 Tax=hydrothermal vent metagenome TaxID=652676 RepID=A0A160TD48_9ZZZZ|nr:hypothetical protein [Thalassolituus oleivorans]MDF1641472.1 hypothetical protein [Thalassolituus oleivorans]PCI46373.1 MAG: hypothetical protein COB43_14280 [Oceanospirillales bacterium]|tara:strand:- start:132 stop:422 length:291 start_codon:yes stop_codon:yes gene_type:complete